MGIPRCVVVNMLDCEIEEYMCLCTCICLCIWWFACYIYTS